MNKGLHRLVFNRNRGMRVAVAETASAAGKAAGQTQKRTAKRGGTTAGVVLGAAAGLLGAAPLHTAVAQVAVQPRPAVAFASQLRAGQPAAAAKALPQPATGRPFAYLPGGDKTKDLRSTGQTTNATPANGQVSWTVDGTTATFNQGTVERVVVNWDSFDIAAGHKVVFKQDNNQAKLVSALNRIWGQDPSLIFGSLTANREVILVNTNGVYFGKGAVVDTGKLVATTLGIADRTFEKGLRNTTDGTAVFSTTGEDHLATQLNSAVSVEEGAVLRSAAGGDVLLIAPRVANRGRIETPQGQSVMAAGDKVYLIGSADPAQRGLIVAVDPVLAADGTPDRTLGTVENAARGSTTVPDTTGALVTRINEIRAESGTVNLVGLAVRQAGLINATTAVRGANGAVFLQAMASTQEITADGADTFGGIRGVLAEAGAKLRVGVQMGSVVLASGSRTQVLPDSSKSTQLDAEVFNRSLVQIDGAQISVEADARVLAPAGRVSLRAAENTLDNRSYSFDERAEGRTNSGGLDNSRIVVAPGAQISAAGLLDVAVDGARNQAAQRLFRIELADVPVQRSGPLYRQEVFFDARDGSKVSAANVAGATAGTGRTVEERSTVGGSVSIASQGSVVLGAGASIDVSGGSLRYSQATIKSTQLLQNGRVVQFAQVRGADPITSLLDSQRSTQTPAYTEGARGGSLQVSGTTQVVLAADLRGQVVQGDRQLAGSSPRAAPASFQLGRLYLSEYTVPSVSLLPRANPSAQTTAGLGALLSALWAEPFGAPLEGLGTDTALALPTLQQAGFGNVRLRAGAVQQTDAGSLNLGLGGVLDVDANRISVNGSYTAPGGALLLKTRVSQADADINVSGTSRLDTAGLWTNDTVGGDTDALDGAARAPAQLSGGRVVLDSAASLRLASGAQVNVSGGARLDAAGVLSTGRAGSITLAATSNPNATTATTLQIAGAALHGYDFAGGGSLQLQAPNLTVAQPASASAAAAANPGDAQTFSLSPVFFSAGGFGQFAVASFGDVRVAAGTTLAPTLLNWQLQSGHRQVPSGAMGAAVVSAQQIDTQVSSRSPVNLSLQATRPLGGGSAEPGASLVVENGARVELEPGGRLNLAASRSLLVGVSPGSDQPANNTSAMLMAPGGEMSLSITGARGGPSDSAGFVPDQALWLGDAARLSVAGTAVLRPSGVGRVTGTVLGGGLINLDAQRGYVLVAPGAVLNLDGAAAQLTLPGSTAPVSIAKAAGMLKVSTSEGFALDGQVSAQPPRDLAGRALADGGRLDVALGAGGVVSGAQGAPYPTSDSGTLKPRQLLVGNSSPLPQTAGLTPGTDLNAALGNGVGQLPSRWLADAGFDSLRLAAGDQIAFQQTTTLKQPLVIELETPVLTADPGVQVGLQTNTLRLGSGSRISGAAAADARALPGSGGVSEQAVLTQLVADAQHIELFGSLGLQRFDRVALSAGRGDVRLMGEVVNRLLAANAGSTDGQLNFSGRLDLTAGHVFAISGTSFSFNGLAAAGPDDPGSRFALQRPGTGAGADTLPPVPLSAFGALSVKATQIEQGGVLRQPMGSIQLQAERGVTLAADSVTSVSGEGAQVLYGSTNNLAAWVLPDRSMASALPRSKGISIMGASVNAAGGAKVDARAGGEVLAPEFFAGVGGSRDAFDTAGVFAVLPDQAGARPLAVGGGQLEGPQAQQQIVITMAGSGLAPGRYTLMPANQALIGGGLPAGAYLVRRASDQGRAVLTTPVPQADGGVVVTAYLSQPGSQTVGTPGERFVVEPLATATARSEVRLTRVSDLLALSGTATALPRDAGQVQVVMTGPGAAQWRGDIDLKAQGKGKAGTLDISATRLALLDGNAPVFDAAAPTNPLTDGALRVQAQVLSGSGAASVLLGGTRTRLAALGSAPAAETWRIDTSATQQLTVEVKQQPLVLQELLMGASGQVTVAAGTQLQASGSAGDAAKAAPRMYTTSGDGALALLSTNVAEVQRTGATLGAGGDLQVAAGTLLSAPTLNLDATGRLQLAEQAQLQAGALALGARRVQLGAGPSSLPNATGASTTVLTGALLTAAQDANSLALRGYSSIDFAGAQLWAQRDTEGTATRVKNSLVIDTPVLRGVAGVANQVVEVDVAARSVLLQNTTGQAADATLVGQGQSRLTLQALPPLRYGSTGGLTLGTGATSLGFATSNLRSQGDAVLQGSGSTRAQGSLTVSAARITASTGADQSLQAAASLTLQNEAGSRTLGERVGQGARVQLAGQTVQQLGKLDLPGAELAISATGVAPSPVGAAAPSLLFGAGSVTSVAGFVLPGTGGFEAQVTAGNISATAALGTVQVTGVLNTSAGLRGDGSRGTGDAGRISLAAAGTGGNVVLAASSLQAYGGTALGDRGGSLQVDSTLAPDLNALATAAATGGATHSFAVRSRTGNLVLGADVQAQQVQISADSGSLTVGTADKAARIQAQAPTGGVVQLSAATDVVLSNTARIDARSTRGVGDDPAGPGTDAGANGGYVLLSSAGTNAAGVANNGRVRIASGAVIDTRGDDVADGRIVVRALRTTNNTSVQIDALNTANLLAGSVDIDAVRVYRNLRVGNETRDFSSINTGNSLLTGTGANRTAVLGQTTVRTDNTAYLTAARNALTGLGVSAAEAARVHLRAGVEVQAAGNLTVTSDWALNAERPGSDAGFLTLRAVGNLAVNGSLSDGFATALSTAALLPSTASNARSWSIRLAAGADLSAANPNTVRDFSTSSADTGNLTVAAGKLVRTGAGDIELAAGRDIRFAAGAGNLAPATVYVAGRRLAGEPDLLAGVFARQAGARASLSEQGGRLTVSATRDVTAPEATQLINNWLYRGGRPNTAAGAEDLYNPISPLAWWVQWANFRQTLGSFGGGDLTVTAGRDLLNVQAMAPTQGWADSLNRVTASIQLRNAANLNVRAGRDVLGGQYLVGSGEGRLDAAGTLGAAVANTRVKVPVPVLMDGSWRLTARTDLNTGPVLNPMALVPGNDRVAASSDFYLWGSSASVSLLSRAGTVATTAVAVTQLGSLGLNSNAIGADANLRVAPPSLLAIAGGGGLNLAPAVMLPALQSTLALWAAGDLQLNGLVMADNAVADWPTARRPAALGLDGVNAIVAGLNTDSLTRTGLHIGDSVPVQLHAQGSINGAGTILALPKAADIFAGLDVINLNLAGQNLREGDGTQVTAGRDVLASLPDGRLSVAGPGSLGIQAGRNIDLGASAGAITTGNQKNPSLPAAGANINLRAAAAGVLDVAAFEASYLTATSGNPRWQSNRQQVLDGVRAALVAPQLTDSEAWAQFQALPAAAQVQLGQRVLAAEFSVTYLAGTVPTPAQMTASLAAGFEQRKAQLLQAADAALASGGSITLPGREVLQGDALASYVKDVRAVSFASIELGDVVAQRLKSLQTAQSGWRDAVAQRLGSTPAALDALPDANPTKAAWAKALADTSSRQFEDYRRQVLVQETSSAGAAASQFGRLSLPLRLALFDQGFQAAELAGVGSFTPSAVWPAGLANGAPSVAYSGRLDMTQSSAITERGGSISLVNPGGAINVGLKELPAGTTRATGVITLRGGDVFGLARDDFQVNTQRVFIVGQGNMNIWSSRGDIDSGRGANTAVAAPPLKDRRSVDGVVYEIPSTTTGSGLGILANTAGERVGVVGLYPALGEILALDAFIRAPSVVLGSTVRGSDNLQAATVSGAVAVVAVPAISVPAPAAAASTTNTNKAADTQQQQTRAQEQRQRNGMLTVELLGIGAEGADKPCEDKPDDPNRCK